ncbi:HET-domain-containing protein [Stipitochalara longipes BDJ]|nr:HET-domain-containing protein [Stipitochalara longipes BDJ]
MSRASGIEDPRAASLAQLIAAILQESDKPPYDYPKQLFDIYESPRVAKGSFSVLDEYGDQQRGQDHQHVPLHCKRRGRQCLVCYAISEGNPKSQVTFICSLTSLVKGYPTVPMWGKTPEEVFRDTYWWREYLQTYSELEDADRIGKIMPKIPQKVDCQTCAMILGGISDFYVHQLRFPPANVSANLEEGLLVSYDDLRLEFYLLYGAPPSPWNVIKSAPHICTDSQSDEAYQNIRRWITECIETHPICPSNEAISLPKRLVDLSDGQNPKLYETTGESGRYIALSHRWGMSLIKTTHNNHSSRRRGINWTELPRVFQDAITITRRLGLRYIWIDSLCIIQDDIRDWQEQLAQMASIYAGSFVTISATSSDSSDSACLSLKNRSQEPVPLNSHQIFVRKQIKHEHIFDSRENDAANPLFNRAWCFQERLLATRILHYTNEEIIFECRTGYQCECGGIWKGKDESVSGCLKLAYAQILEESRKSGKGDRYLGPTLSSSCNKETLLWFRVLSDYTKKQMTFERDTLPALSGVADRMPSDLMGKYLAGLWQNDLLYGLLWRSADEMKCQRHHTYIAPSFSWASRAGPITFPPFTSRYQPSASILKAECELATTNRTGEVRGGFVKLRGALVQLSYARDTQEKTSPPTSFLQKERSDQKAVIMIDTQQDVAEVDPCPVFCLSMLQFGRPPKHVALVLKQSNSPGRPDGFVRIGIASEVPGLWFRNAADREVTIY